MPHAIKAVLLGAVLIVCFSWADGAVYQYLHANFNENTRPVPDLLKLPHRILRSLEDWGENVFIVFVLFAMWRLDPQRRGRVVCLIAGALLTSAVVEVVKRSTGRIRPDASHGATVFVGLSRSADSSGDAQSFPSGHTASAGSFGGALSAFYPPLKPAMILLTCGTGASRIWKERHFLSDCLVGGLLGWIVASSVAKSRRLQPLWNWCDSKLAPSNPIANYSLIRSENAVVSFRPRAIQSRRAQIRV